MRKIALVVLICVLSNICICQVISDSLKGIYVGELYYKKSTDSSWIITPDSEYVVSIDTLNCYVDLVGPVISNIGFNTSFWSDYSFCNGTFNPPTEPTGYAYPKFYSMDSIKVYYVWPPPPPNTFKYYKRFFGKRIPGSYVGIRELLDLKMTKIYPNPANEKLHISLESGKSNILLYNCFGVLLLISDQREVDVSSLPAGIYYAKIQVNSKVYNHKIVIQH